MQRLPPLLLALFLSGCTAAKATYQLVLAEQSVQRAEEYGAPELAVYEYTMSQRYLEKAREEAGYADYRVCVDLATKSAEWADKAIISIEQRGSNKKLDLEDVEGLPQAPVTPPVTPPPGTPPPSTPPDSPPEGADLLDGLELQESLP